MKLTKPVTVRLPSMNRSPLIVVKPTKVEKPLTANPSVTDRTPIVDAPTVSSLTSRKDT